MRREANEQVAEQISEMEAEGTFVCPSCGDVARDSERCERTGECVYCDDVRRPESDWRN